MRSVESKFSTVIEKNTFYFSNPAFEEKYEGYLNSIKETLLVLKNSVEINGLRKELIEELLERENGLTTLLALTGFSNESFKRLITLIRVTDDSELSKLVLKDEWCPNESLEDVTEWKDPQIAKIIHQSEHFRKGIVNIFFEGATIPFLANTIPLFELKKLSISKLTFEMPAMIDTLVRYKEKGSYSGKGENNAETVIAERLDSLTIAFEKGDLNELIDYASDRKRTMDFIIPNKKQPRVIVECSFLVTTSSNQGDKSKTEIAVAQLLQEHYPEAKFIGFVDGIGWYVRPTDLVRMVAAYEDVFTFHQEELSRFEQFLRKEFQN
jgi:hypothetical protein